MAPPTTTTDLSRDVPLARNYQDRNISPRFGDFVTRNDQYYKHVARIRQNIKTYIRKHRPKRPLNILLGTTRCRKELPNKTNNQGATEGADQDNHWRFIH